MSNSRNSEPLVDIRCLSKLFPIHHGFMRRVVGNVRAVEDVSLEIHPGETVGLVGESGSGKTTLGRCVLKAIQPSSGRIITRFDGQALDLVPLSASEIRPHRRHMQMVFQDPYSSLDPRMTVLDIIGEPLKTYGVATGRNLERCVLELMDVVGLDTKHLKRYPHAFSGGQRQRIGIARALALHPKFIVCDEAVSALDVSVQAQILNLLRRLQEEFHLTYLFVAHDLSVVKHIAERVAVMYLGRLMEVGQTDELFRTPAHPYTEALLSAVPRIDPDKRRKRIILVGEQPNPAAPPSGCPFHTRCAYTQPVCSAELPEWRQISETHASACHFATELEMKGVHR